MPKHGLRKHRSVQAKRRFGQHFLKDQSVLQSIEQILALKPEQYVLEIGPGTGALTQALIASKAQLTVVEIDTDMVAQLRRRWAGLNIIQADILKLDLDSLLAGKKWRLVGNLPYNISTPLLARLPSWRPQIQDALFMLQEEVATRIAALPGTKRRGRLSVLMQHSFTVTLQDMVPPEAFEPKPAVHSRLVYLQPLPKVAKIVNSNVFFWLVKTTFNQRRKTLSNTLKNLPGKLSANINLIQLLAGAAIDGQSRAEELSVADFVRLANHLTDQLELPSA